MEKQMGELMSLMKNLEQDRKEIKIEQQNRKAKKKIEDLKREVERMEGKKRKKNIVIQGLRGSSTNSKILKEEMEGFMEKALGVTLKVEIARKLREDMCLVELNSKSDKSMVMQCKNKLRNLSEKVCFCVATDFTLHVMVIDLAARIDKIEIKIEIVPVKKNVTGKLQRQLPGVIASTAFTAKAGMDQRMLIV
ncbi:hypothetical protein FQA39_LY12055 [Lamprigera yunnana]|nr:hypothetical protein FQA39_LY12055 [Lamprigera yunnana]